MNLGDTVPIGATSLQFDPVTGTGGTGTYGAPAITQYVCDDGSIPDGVDCADGTDAVFYSTSGEAENSLAVASPSEVSVTTVIVLGIVAWFLFKGKV
jgi:hypothetical protein